MTPPKPPDGPQSRRDEMSEAQARYEADVRAGAAPSPMTAVPRHKAVAAAQARKAMVEGVGGGETRTATGGIKGGGVSLRFSRRAPISSALWIASAGFALAALVAFFAVALHDAVWRDHRWLAHGTGPGAGGDAPPVDMSFTLMVNSTPSGAELFVDGQARGQTPAMVNVACAGGEEISIRVEKKGYKGWGSRVPCQKGGTIRSTMTLERAPAEPRRAP